MEENNHFWKDSSIRASSDSPQGPHICLNCLLQEVWGFSEKSIGIPTVQNGKHLPLTLRPDISY